jgi:hypothetical protein
VTNDRDPTGGHCGIPRYLRRQFKPGHGVVVSPEQAPDLDQHLVGRDLRARTAGHLSGYVRKDFAALVVDAEHARSAIEAYLFEVSQQEVDRGGPRAGAAPHSVPDPYDGADVAREVAFREVVIRFHAPSLQGSTSTC